MSIDFFTEVPLIVKVNQFKTSYTFDAYVMVVAGRNIDLFHGETFETMEELNKAIDDYNEVIMQMNLEVCPRATLNHLYIGSLRKIDTPGWY